MTEILRHEWGFKGYVVSDSEAVEFLYSKHKVAADAVDGAAQVINAGLNVRTNFLYLRISSIRFVMLSVKGRSLCKLLTVVLLTYYV